MARLIVCFLGLVIVTAAWAGPLEELKAGQEALAYGRLEEALDLLTRASGSTQLPNEQRAEAYFSLGRIYERWGYWGDAEKNYAWAVTLDRSRGAYLDSLKKMRRKTETGGP